MELVVLDVVFIIEEVTEKTAVKFSFNQSTATRMIVFLVEM